MKDDSLYDQFFNDIAKAIRTHSKDEEISCNIESEVLRVISKYSAAPNEPKNANTASNN